MAYTVYFESGRGDAIKHRKRIYKTKARAVAVARRASRMTGGYVTVSRGGHEVAECLRGTCAIR